MSIDDELALAQEIRRVDGQHNKGAAALAEALMPWLAEHDREKDDRIEALEAERDEYKKQADCWSLAEQEVQALEARLARVKALHRPTEPLTDAQGDTFGGGLCAECLDENGAISEYPCPTIRALAADEQEAGL